MKVTISVDVPDEYSGQLVAEVRNAVRAIRNRYVCPSTYGDDVCVLAFGHDGPECTDGSHTWTNPFSTGSPAPGQRVFEAGRKVRHRSSGTIYRIESVVDGTVSLVGRVSTASAAADNGFWSTYYAIADRPEAPTLTIDES